MCAVTRVEFPENIREMIFDRADSDAETAGYLLVGIG
jgi:hypothetical protein